MFINNVFSDGDQVFTKYKLLGVKTNCYCFWDRLGARLKILSDSRGLKIIWNGLEKLTT